MPDRFRMAFAGIHRTGGQTACDIPGTRRAIEIGFAIHESDALGGARVELPVANRTRRIGLRDLG